MLTLVGYAHFLVLVFFRGNKYLGANIYTFCMSAVRWLQRHRATPHNCVAVFLVESHWTGVISQSREYIYPQQHQQHQGIEHRRRRRRLGCHRSQAGLMKRHIPHICHGRHGRRPYKFFLASVNFFRCNAKNRQFTV